MGNRFGLQKLNKSDRLCSTAERPLPGSNESREETSKKSFRYRIRFVILRFIVTVPEHYVYSNERLDKTLVCECEAVTAGEVRYAVDELNVII
ncbi:sn-glycerol-3-phosphate dehydrogenase subunit A [Actinobacillus pleuropneumoniae]|nr:sn-glycerol-3-phosphate dehydrogenase subunit A [Actinobacillus pleuropneumoniae]